MAAIAATAFSYPALAYCRGCVIETRADDVALAARAEALPDLPPIRSECHVEKQLRQVNGRAIVRRVRICE